MSFEGIYTLLARCIVLVLVIPVHEAAHGWLAYKLGDPTPRALGRLTINPLKHLDIFGMLGFLLVGFGWAKPVQVNPMNFKKYKRDMFLVSISGVLTNLILAFIFCGAFYFYFTNVAQISATGFSYSNSLLYFIHFFLESTITLNLALFVFNLIPVYPLDGFNAIKSLCKYNNKFINFMYRYGSIVLLVIIITPIFDIVYSNVTYYLSEVFFGFWRLFA